MRILLTNDDGYDAPGILALWQALRPLPDLELEVIAPAESHSCKGHVFADSIRVRSGRLDPIGAIRIVDGTPADCVCAAMNLPGLARPDWVVAGINRGSNLGVDLYNSGTAAAARQAAIFGVPAIAISQLLRKGKPDDWPRTTREAAAILAAILTVNRSPGDDEESPLAPPQSREGNGGSALAGGDGIAGTNPAARNRGSDRGAEGDGQCSAPSGIDAELFDLVCGELLTSAGRLAPGEFYNVNIPKLPADRSITEVRLVPPSRDPTHQSYDHSTDEEGNPILTYTGVYLRRPAAPGTDVAAVFADAVSISRVRV